MKYGQLPTKGGEEIRWNILGVDIIRPYAIRRKGQKENLHLKNVTVIYHVTGWFEKTQYNDIR